MSDRDIHEKLDQVLARLDRIEALLLIELIEGKFIMSALDDLTAQVAASTTVESSAVLLIKGIAAQIAAAGTNPTSLQALQASLKSSADALAAAVAANTPAA